MLENSPWYKLYKFAPPHFPFCGDMAQGWVLDPVDTYTSAFYLFSSYFIYREAKSAPRILKNIAIIPIFVTIGSILFHMSFTFTFLVADFLGIFFLNFYGIFLNLTRLKKLNPSKVPLYSFYGTLIYAVLMALTYHYHIHSGLLMLPILAVYLGSEWLCSRKEDGTSYRSYWMAFFLIAGGYMAMLIEGPPLRLGCVNGPFKGYLQLHSVWHLFSATSMIFVFRFYNQRSLKRVFINSPEGSQN